MPRRTDSNNPADWLLIVSSDLEMIRLCCEHETAYAACRSKLSEIIEKILKAELIRLGWFLKKTHDLRHLTSELRALGSDLPSAIDGLVESFAEVYFTDRYPGFDLEDPDWPAFRAHLAEVEQLFATVKARVDNTAPTA